MDLPYYSALKKFHFRSMLIASVYAEVGVSAEKGSNANRKTTVFISVTS